MGHSGPSTEEKCRISGTRLGVGRPSTMTAAFRGVIAVLVPFDATW